MIDEYKKGDTVIILYKKPNHAYIMESVGIVFDMSDAEIIIAHNFSGINPIDLTKVRINKIIDIKKIAVNEINTSKDIALSTRGL